MNEEKKQHILFRVGLGKPAARKFEKDLNAFLDDGWTCDQIAHARQGWFRFVAMAKLSKVSV